jgi:site-specific recombinase XerD
VRGYRADWADFSAWRTDQSLEPLPSAPATVSGYFTSLTGRGLAVGTMSRRLSAVRFAHQLRDPPDPTTIARVVAVC